MEKHLHEQAARMFRLFARFEYALKAAGFHNGNGKALVDAKPDWTAFARSIEEPFTACTHPSFREALTYIGGHPPKKQVVRNGVLEWDEAAPESRLEADRTLIYVRRVRNNLFHGGKFNGRWFEEERSERLLHHSMVILKTCLELSPVVKEAYRSR